MQTLFSFFFLFSKQENRQSVVESSARTNEIEGTEPAPQQTVREAVQNNFNSRYKHLKIFSNIFRKSLKILQFQLLSCFFVIYAWQRLQQNEDVKIILQKARASKEWKHLFKESVKRKLKSIFIPCKRWTFPNLKSAATTTVLRHFIITA